MYHIFLGADPREKEALQVAKYSIDRFNNPDITTHVLESRDLRKAGLYTRTYHVTAEGQMVDDGDGRPFSTDFSFTRFLVPELWRQQQGKKSSLVMFVDSDFLFLENPINLFKEVEAAKLRSPKAPLYVVQHNYKPTSDTKMDGVQQHSYNRKLHSSLMVIDMDHPDNAHLTPDAVNTASGRDLHNFAWVADQHSIGSVHERWNYIPDHSSKNIKEPPSALHWTTGGVWFKDYRNVPYGDLWWRTYSAFLVSKITKIEIDGNSIIHGDN